jgi:hypothetical protein
MIRQIEKIAKRQVKTNFSCRESLKVVRSMYGQFGVEIFKQLVRLEREKSKNNQINNLSLISI